MVEDIFTLIAIVGLIQSVFLFLVLISSWKNITTSSIWSIALITVFIIDITWCLGYKFNLLEQFTVFKIIELIPMFLYAPVLYFYIKSKFFTSKMMRLKPSDLVHLLPITLVTFIFHSSFFKISFVDGLFNGVITNTFAFEVFLWNIQVLVYAFLTYRFFQSLKDSNKNKLTYDQNSKKAHMLIVKILYMIFLIFVLVLTIDTYFEVDFSAINFNATLLVLHVFIISYISFVNKEVLLTPIKLFKNKATNLSGLNTERLEQDLLKSMQQNHFYKDKNLSLKSLSKELELTPHQLSEYINSKKGITFNDYVNTFRVEHAQLLLKDSKNDIYTLEGIADQSGFRSLATFHRNFKKHSGISPKKWLDTQ